MNKSRWMTVLLGSTLVAVSAGAMAQQKEKPGKIRSEMTRAEKEYVDLYNKLNTDPRFAIVCVTDRPTGSSMPVRVCQPRYVMSAREASASQRMQAASTASDSTGQANAAGPNVGAAVAGGGIVGAADVDEAFRQNMLAVQQKSPELQALGMKRDELQARYNEALKGGK